VKLLGATVAHFTLLGTLLVVRMEGQQDEV